MHEADEREAERQRHAARQYRSFTMPKSTESPAASRFRGRLIPQPRFGAECLAIATQRHQSKPLHTPTSRRRFVLQQLDQV